MIVATCRKMADLQPARELRQAGEVLAEIS